MSLLPEWAPNVHPLIVHFPIALLVAAAIVDSIGMIFKNQEIWRRSSVGLYAGGTIAASLAWFTGRQAADSVFLPTEAQALLTQHSDLGHYLFYAFAAYAIARVSLFVLKLDKKPLFRSFSYVIGLAGIVLLWITADHGAQLVYVYGVGVQAVPQETLVLATNDSSRTSGPAHNERGGWTFKPTRASAWLDSMTSYGSRATLQTSMRDGGERGDVLALSSSGEAVMLTFDYPMITVQIDAALNLDNFDGSIMIVHHVIDENNYHFTSISREDMKQGRSENGDLYLLDNKPYTPSGWHTYRVVADQTHFRAYSDQTLVTHGHGDDPGSGFVGIRLNGSGTVLLDFVHTVSLRGEGLVAAETIEPQTEDHEH